MCHDNRINLFLIVFFPPPPPPSRPVLSLLLMIQEKMQYLPFKNDNEEGDNNMLARHVPVPFLIT
jgi:hypothetical protein